MNNPEKVPSPENLQSLIKRFARARWIERSIITPEPFAIDFTFLGKSRIEYIACVLNAVTKENFPNPSDVRATENGNHIINELADVYEELGPEKLSCAEFDILIGLAITFYRQNERKP